MAAPVLADHQFWFGVHDEGILFGLDTDIDVVEVDGLEAFDVRSGSRELPRDDGAVPGYHLVNQKMPVFDIEALTDSQYYEFLDVIEPYRNHEGELHWKFPGRGQVFMRGRPRSRTARRDGLTQGALPISVAFEIADPRIYGVDLHQGSIPIYTPSSGGLDFEVDFEVDFTGSGSTGEFVAVNAGNSNAYPIVRFFGPDSGTCTAVLLENIDTGVDLDIDTTITAGQILTADMDSRKRGSGSRIIDLAGASKYGDWQLPRETFYLQPRDNTLRLSITGSSTDVSAIINWRDTFY